MALSRSRMGPSRRASSRSATKLRNRSGEARSDPRGAGRFGTARRSRRRHPNRETEDGRDPWLPLPTPRSSLRAWRSSRSSTPTPPCASVLGLLPRVRGCKQSLNRFVNLLLNDVADHGRITVSRLFRRGMDCPPCSARQPLFHNLSAVVQHPGDLAPVLHKARTTTGSGTPRIHRFRILLGESQSTRSVLRRSTPDGGLLRSGAGRHRHGRRQWGCCWSP
jgi:hypothetical protein